jgi:hypothetical protein
VGLIVNLRGTSGSGKSHIVRAVMARCTSSFHMGINPEYKTVLDDSALFERRSSRPLGYECVTPNGPLWIAGHYECATGGADRLLGNFGMTRDDLYALVCEKHDAGYHVLYEGLLVSEVPRCAELRNKGRELVVIHLTTPLDVCIQSIQARRAARGDDRPLSLDHTKNKHRELLRMSARLRALGVDVRDMDRETALATVMGLFGWPQTVTA